MLRHLKPIWVHVSFIHVLAFRRISNEIVLTVSQIREMKAPIPSFRTKPQTYRQ